MVNTITIAGTAGRKEDGESLNKDLYSKMVDRTFELIIDEIITRPNGRIGLVSGGAAYADHIAVLLFLAHPSIFKLTLCLPTILEAKAYLDTGEQDWRTNPGKTANYYHKRFNQVTGANSFDEMHQAKQLGAQLEAYAGFHARNKVMAKSDAAIVLTFGEKEIKDGGTKNMADSYLKFHPENSLLKHIALPSLSVYSITTP